MSAAFDIATVIANLGMGTLASDLFVNRMPETPDACTTVYEYGGKPTDFAMGSSVAVEHASLQVAVRNTSAQAGYEAIYAMYKRLDGHMGGVVNGTMYFLMTAMQPPFKLEEDDRQRVKFVFNLMVRKDRS